MTDRIPPIPPGIGPPEFQVWWQQAVEAIQSQQSDQEEFNTSVTRALSDAGIALNAAQQRMPSLPPWQVALTVAGVPTTGQLPRNIQFRRYEGGDEVTLNSEWTATLLSGAAAFTIGAANGLLELIDLDATSVIEVMSIRDDVPLTTLWKAEAVQSAILATINSNAHAVISDVLTFKTGSLGTLTLNATLDVLTGDASPTGTFPVFGKLQYNNAGWIDAAAEVESAADAAIEESPTAGEYLLTKGQLIVGATVAGLAANTEYPVRLQARNSSGTRVIAFNGTISGVGT